MYEQYDIFYLVLPANLLSSHCLHFKGERIENTEKLSNFFKVTQVLSSGAEVGLRLFSPQSHTWT